MEVEVAAMWKSCHLDFRTVAVPCYPCHMSTKKSGNAAITYLGVAAVAVVAAIVSFEHLRELGERAGEEWRAYLLPFSVDGLMVASGAAIVQAKRAGQKAPLMSLLGLFTGILGSLAANIAVAQPTVEGRLVSAWPAVALLISTEILLRRVPVKAEALPEAKLPPSVLVAEQRAIAAETSAIASARATLASTKVEVPRKSVEVVPPNVADAIAAQRKPTEAAATRTEAGSAAAEARATFAASVDAGEPMSAKDLAEMYGRSARWARDIRRSVQEGR